MKSSPLQLGRRLEDMQYGGILLRRKLSLLTGGNAIARPVHLAAIVAEEVRRILEGRTRGSGNGANVRPTPSPHRNFYGQKVT